MSEHVPKSVQKATLKLKPAKKTPAVPRYPPGSALVTAKRGRTRKEDSKAYQANAWIKKLHGDICGIEFNWPGFEILSEQGELFHIINQDQDEPRALKFSNDYIKDIMLAGRKSLKAIIQRLEEDEEDVSISLPEGSMAEVIVKYLTKFLHEWVEHRRILLEGRSDAELKDNDKQASHLLKQLRKAQADVEADLAFGKAISESPVFVTVPSTPASSNGSSPSQPMLRHMPAMFEFTPPPTDKKAGHRALFAPRSGAPTPSGFNADPLDIYANPFSRSLPGLAQPPQAKDRNLDISQMARPLFGMQGFTSHQHKANDTGPAFGAPLRSTTPSNNVFENRTSSPAPKRRRTIGPASPQLKLNGLGGKQNQRVTGHMAFDISTFFLAVASPQEE